MTGERLVAFDRTKEFERYVQKFNTYSPEELEALVREQGSQSLVGGFIPSFFDSDYDIRCDALKHVLNERSLLNRVY